MLSDDPYTTDERTYHEAVEVVKGRKYAANFWIHMFEFQEALKRGCEKCLHLPDSHTEPHSGTHLLRP